MGGRAEFLRKGAPLALHHPPSPAPWLGLRRASARPSSRAAAPARLPSANKFRLRRSRPVAKNQTGPPLAGQGRHATADSPINQEPTHRAHGRPESYSTQKPLLELHLWPCRNARATGLCITDLELEEPCARRLNPFRRRRAAGWAPSPRSLRPTPCMTDVGRWRPNYYRRHLSSPHWAYRPLGLITDCSSRAALRAYPLLPHHRHCWVRPAGTEFVVQRAGQ